MSGDKKTTVPVIPRAAIRASNRKKRRPTIKLVDSTKVKRVAKKIVRDGDVVQNNGRLSENRKGQIAMVVSTNESLQIATVASEDGIVEWTYSEIVRIAEGQCT